MADRLGQYKKALRAIGDQRLAALTENVPARFTLDDVWQDSVDYVLKQSTWKFAKRIVKLGANADIETNFGPRYAFTIPDDYLRLDDISLTPNFAVPFTAYKENNNHWWTDATDVLYVSYISNDNNYGGDLGRWPVEFAEAQAYYMARQSAMTITKSGVSRDSLDRDYMVALSRAKSLDTIGDPPARKPLNSWAKARLGGDRGPRRAF